ncbi:unnamed protein product, partial [Meganyctiphanes norvegica]
ERLISDYAHILNAQPKHVKGSGSLANQILNSKGEVDPNMYIVKPSMYYIHMENVLKFFKRDQILVVDGSQMSKDPLPVLQKLEKFLDIPQWYNEERLYYNKSKGFYCMNINHDIKCLNSAKGREHPTLDS